MTIKELHEQQNARLREATAIRDLVKAESRDMSEDEAQQVDELMNAYDQLGTEIAAAKEREQETAKRLSRLADAEKAGKEIPAATKRLAITGVRPAVEGDPKKGFRSFGDYLQSVIHGSLRGTTPDRRLFWAHGDGDPQIGAATLSTYGTGDTGQDGGYAIPPAFSAEIQSYVLGEESLLQYCNVIEIEGNSLTYPRDVSTPWGSTGAQVYVVGEAGAITQSKPAIEYGSLRLIKFATLVPLTDELIADARALEQWLPRATGEALVYKVNDKIINGTGANEPTGIKNSGALLSQAKESGQTADTITDGNVSAMFGRLLPQSTTKAIWLIAPDAWNQLPQMTVGDMPVFMSPNKSLMDALPFKNGALYGRPVIKSWQCQTLGDAGDIYLADFSRYIVITKAGSTVEQTSSIHLWFDQDTTAFRSILRMNGQPMADEYVTAANGTSTFSPFITLAARA